MKLTLSYPIRLAHVLAATTTSAAMTTEWGAPLQAPWGGQLQIAFTHEDGVPTRMETIFDKVMLTNAPTVASDEKNDVLVSKFNDTVHWYCCGFEMEPEYPTSILGLTRLKHSVFNINPHGHPPAGIFDTPHIDFHYYLTSSADRLDIPGVKYEKRMCGPSIPMKCSDANKLTAHIPDDQRAEGYMNFCAVEPEMGNHLLNPALPGSGFGPNNAFTHTWIYLSAYGNISGLEPMITFDSFYDLVPGQEVCTNMIMPQAFKDEGYYPTRYCMEYRLDAGEKYVVALKNWEWFPCSDGFVSEKKKFRCN